MQPLHALALVGFLMTGCRESEPKNTTDFDADTDVDPGGPPVPDAPPMVDEDGDGSDSLADCDDGDPAVYPGAPDLCGDDRVTDCDRTSDDGLVTVDGLTGFDDLALALASASAGSELLVCPGIYVGSFVATEPVVLRSLAGADLTVLDGDRSGTTLSVPGGSTVVGLTLRNGDALEAGGMQLTSPGSLTLEACTITHNDANVGGGLVIGPDSVATLTDTLVTDNTSYNRGGGIVVESGSTVALVGSSAVRRNAVANGSGGGVSLVDATLSGGEVSENSSETADLAWDSCMGFHGGGIQATGTSTLDGVDVWGNQGVWGAGVGVTNGTVVLTDVRIHDNRSSFDGGGIAVASASIELFDTEVYANEASDFGGGLFACGAGVAGGLFYENTARNGGGAFVLRSDAVGIALTGNTAEAGAGASLWEAGTLTGATISENTATVHGGGVHVEAEEAAPPIFSITTSTVSDNLAPEGAAFYAATATIALEAVTVERNVAEAGGSAIRLVRDGAVEAIDCALGSGVDDNQPDDVAYPDGSAWSYGFGSFTCTDEGCSP